MPSKEHLAPGMRVIIRDEEWVVRKAELSSDGGQQLTCDGLSELVKGKEAIFLTRLEGEIQILDPVDTQLVDDDSPGYARSLLFFESQLRKRAINDQKIHIAHQGAMDLVPYQLDPALQALNQPRQRILIADAVGLGKTLEAGILTSELIHRGRGKRILVLTLKSMMTQFQKEFWNRFTIPLTRLDSVGLQRVRSRIPTNHNPFYYYDKSIISIDTLKQDSEYRIYLEQAYWDIIIIDECHNVAERGTHSQRARLAKRLSTRSDTLIMLSATPHDGKARSFASLMNMLDPTAIADAEHYNKEDFSEKGLVVRRFKKDIQDQVDREFKKRHVISDRHPASNQEEDAYEALLQIPFTRNGEAVTGHKGTLLRVTLQKALFSSPAACSKSVAERIRKLQNRDETTEDELLEIDALQTLDLALQQITPQHYAKYQSLISRLKSTQFGWSHKVADDRLVIFSERIETLHFLEKQLQKDLKLKARQVTLLHGGMSDIEQQEIVEQFGNRESPLRLLLCSDVASEGINLHYQSHRLIHFDLPWSLMVFQQRNGRVDRYGQEHEPQILYLITESQHETIRGDMRILEVLEEKDQQAYENIGDPSVFMGVYDAAEEEKLTENAIADGQQAEQFNQQYQPEQHESEGEDLLALFLGTAEEPSTDTTVQDEQAQSDPIVPPVTLYPNHYDWCKAALNQIVQNGEPLQFSTNDQNQQITLTASDDLLHRFKFLPKEIQPLEGQLTLTDQIDTIKQEIARSREDENAWPKIHYLWPQHPASEWLADRMMSAFGRHTAPVITLKQGIEHNEKHYLFSGLIPNQKSHPLINEWFSVRFINGQFDTIQPFEEVIEQTRLGQRPIPNPNRSELPAQEQLQQLLPQAVAEARRWMKQQRNRFESEINQKLNAQLEELDRLKEGQLQQLEMVLNSSREVEGRKAQRRAQRQQEIEEVFDHYLMWVQETMTTEPHPYLQLICVLQGEG